MAHGDLHEIVATYLNDLTQDEQARYLYFLLEHQGENDRLMLNLLAALDEYCGLDDGWRDQPVWATETTKTLTWRGVLADARALLLSGVRKLAVGAAVVALLSLASPSQAQEPESRLAWPDSSSRVALSQSFCSPEDATDFVSNLPAHVQRTVQYAMAYDPVCAARWEQKLGKVAIRASQVTTVFYLVPDIEVELGRSGYGYLVE